MKYSLILLAFLIAGCGKAATTPGAATVAATDVAPVSDIYTVKFMSYDATTAAMTLLATDMGSPTVDQVRTGLHLSQVNGGASVLGWRLMEGEATGRIISTKNNVIDGSTWDKLHFFDGETEIGSDNVKDNTTYKVVFERTCPQCAT